MDVYVFVGVKVFVLLGVAVRVFVGVRVDVFVGVKVCVLMRVGDFVTVLDATAAAKRDFVAVCVDVLVGKISDVAVVRAARLLAPALKVRIRSSVVNLLMGDVGRRVSSLIIVIISGVSCV